LACGDPEGWLWIAIIAAAFESMLLLKTSLGLTIAELSVPTLQMLRFIICPFDLRLSMANTSLSYCLSSFAITSRTSLGDVIGSALYREGSLTRRMFTTFTSFSFFFGMRHHLLNAERIDSPFRDLFDQFFKFIETFISYFSMTAPSAFLILSSLKNPCSGLP
jgi:hypothetical protein